MLLMHIYRRLWIVIQYIEMMMMYDRVDYETIYIHDHSYECSMWWWTYNDTCIENDNAGGMLFLWFVYYYYHNYCDGVWMWITIMTM